MSFTQTIITTMLTTVFVFIIGAFGAPTPQYGASTGSSSVGSATTNAAPAPVQIQVTSSATNGYATSSNLNTGIYRDGGDGACVNGLCVIGFSDTTVCNGPFQTSGYDALTNYCKSVSGNNAIIAGNSFAHNTFATFHGKDRNANAHPPQDLYDFGKHNVEEGLAVGQLVGATLGPESDEDSNYAIWPNSNLVSIPAGPNMGASDVVGVYNVLTVGSATHYNTMAKITITDDVPDGHNLPAQRIVPQLYQAGQQSLYGTYSLMASHTDDCSWNGQSVPCLYLFARDLSHDWQVTSSDNHNGIKVARVSQASILDTTQYQYWDGSDWVAQAPGPSDRKSEFIASNDTYMDTGEFFWNNHFNKYAHVSSWDGAFTIQYSDSITDGWSAPQQLYDAQEPNKLQGYMYAGLATWGGRKWQWWNLHEKL